MFKQARSFSGSSTASLSYVMPPSCFCHEEREGSGPPPAETLLSWCKQGVTGLGCPLARSATSCNSRDLSVPRFPPL